jgi:mono/diheme cytochrome c family protein
VPFADKMSPPVPSLSSKDVQDYKDGQLKWIIKNGINPSGMPAWKGTLSDEEMWNVVDFFVTTAQRKPGDSRRLQRRRKRTRAHGER